MLPAHTVSLLLRFPTLPLSAQESVWFVDAAAGAGYDYSLGHDAVEDCIFDEGTTAPIVIEDCDNVVFERRSAVGSTV